MYIIRDVFTAKPGQASLLAKLFKKMFTPGQKGRVLTDMVGPYNTVIMEMEVDNLADWEKMMADYKAGKMDPSYTPEMLEEMGKYTEMYLHGHREILQTFD